MFINEYWFINNIKTMADNKNPLFKGKNPEEIAKAKKELTKHIDNLFPNSEKNNYNPNDNGYSADTGTNPFEFPNSDSVDESMLFGEPQINEEEENVLYDKTNVIKANLEFWMSKGDIPQGLLQEAKTYENPVIKNILKEYNSLKEKPRTKNNPKNEEKKGFLAELEVIISLGVELTLEKLKEVENLGLGPQVKKLIKDYAVKNSSDNSILLTGKKPLFVLEETREQKNLRRRKTLEDKLTTLFPREGVKITTPGISADLVYAYQALERLTTIPSKEKSLSKIEELKKSIFFKNYVKGGNNYKQTLANVAKTFGLEDVFSTINKQDHFLTGESDLTLAYISEFLSVIKENFGIYDKKGKIKVLSLSQKLKTKKTIRDLEDKKIYLLEANQIIISGQKKHCLETVSLDEELVLKTYKSKIKNEQSKTIRINHHTVKGATNQQIIYQKGIKGIGPNLVKATFDENNNEYYFIMEYYDPSEKPNMFDYLKKNNISFAQYFSIVKSSLITMHEMHEKGEVLHRDLKPENFYLDLEKFEAIITDLDVSKRTDLPSVKIDDFGGTIRYAARESILQEELDKSELPKIDLYSWSISMAEILLGKHPRQLDKKEFKNIHELFSTTIDYLSDEKGDKQIQEELILNQTLLESIIRGVGSYLLRDESRDTVNNFIISQSGLKIGTKESRRKIYDVVPKKVGGYLKASFALEKILLNERLSTIKKLKPHTENEFSKEYVALFEEVLQTYKELGQLLEMTSKVDYKNRETVSQAIKMMSSIEQRVNENPAIYHQIVIPAYKNRERTKTMSILKGSEFLKTIN